MTSLTMERFAGIKGKKNRVLLHITLYYESVIINEKKKNKRRCVKNVGFRRNNNNNTIVNYCDLTDSYTSAKCDVRIRVLPLNFPLFRVRYDNIIGIK